MFWGLPSGGMLAQTELNTRCTTCNNGALAEEARSWSHRVTSASPGAQDNGRSTAPQERPPVAVPTAVAGTADRNASGGAYRAVAVAVAANPTGQGGGAAIHHHGGNPGLNVGNPGLSWDNHHLSLSDHEALPAALVLSAMLRSKPEADGGCDQELEKALRAVLIVDPTSTLHLTGSRERRNELLNKVSVEFLTAHLAGNVVGLAVAGPNYLSYACG